MQADLLQAGLYALVLVAVAMPLGWYMAQVFTGQITFLAPIERAILGAAGARGAQRWTSYAAALVISNFAGFMALLLMLRFQ